MAVPSAVPNVLPKIEPIISEHLREGYGILKMAAMHKSRRHRQRYSPRRPALVLLMAFDG